MIMLSLMLTVMVLALAVAGLRTAGIILLVEVVFGGLLLGMANVALLLGSPPVSATSEEIRAAAKVGPGWLKRQVAKLDDQS